MLFHISWNAELSQSLIPQYDEDDADVNMCLDIVTINLFIQNKFWLEYILFVKTNILRGFYDSTLFAVIWALQVRKSQSKTTTRRIRRYISWRTGSIKSFTIMLYIILDRYMHWCNVDLDIWFKLAAQVYSNCLKQSTFDILFAKALEYFYNMSLSSNRLWMWQHWTKSWRNFLGAIFPFTRNAFANWKFSCTKSYRVTRLQE